jgi:hypothetical protein
MNRATEEMKHVAPEVMTALDKYRAANGAYPDSLDKLVPTYLDRLPTCSATSSRRMGYSAGSNPATGEMEPGEYQLYCPSFLFTREGYSSKTKQWYSWD